MKVLQSISFGIILLFVLSCDKPCKDSVTGTFQDMSELSNCGWIIQLPNGSRLMPINLDDFDVVPNQGASISFDYTERTDLAGTCMAGTIVEIECVKD